jgi:hypothetical protein
MWPGLFPSRKSTTLARAAAFRYKLSRIQLLALTTREDYELGKTDYPPDVLEKVYSKALLKCVLGHPAFLHAGRHCAGTRPPVSTWKALPWQQPL